MIIHVDMDAFYASVEQRDRPELAGQAVIVGGTPEGRGVVAAANYEARKFGVHSAMPAVTAKRLCPHAVFIRPRMDHYADISRRIREIFYHFTPLVEPLALDEAFLDATGSERLLGRANDIARQIKKDIRGQLQLVASVGVAPNKFVAKIASDLEKPDGFVVVDAQHVQSFLDPLPIERLWGVGRAGSRSFHHLGVHTIGQLRQLPMETLQGRFGRMGDHLFRLARGMDDRTVQPDREAKSISHETTFETDVADLEVLRAWLLELTDQVARRLRRHHLRCRTVQLKIRFSDFHTITRAQTLSAPTHATDQLWEAAAQILDARLPERHLPVRLLGMGVTGIVPPSHPTQGQLFDIEQQQLQEELDAVGDRVKDRYGSAALRRGASLLRDDRPEKQ